MGWFRIDCSYREICLKIMTPISEHSVYCCLLKKFREGSEESQHGKQKKFLRIQDGINPTQDLIYEILVARRSNLTLEENRKCFVKAGVG